MPLVNYFRFERSANVAHQSHNSSISGKTNLISLAQMVAGILGENVPIPNQITETETQFWVVSSFGFSCLIDSLWRPWPLFKKHHGCHISSEGGSPQTLLHCAGQHHNPSRLRLGLPRSLVVPEV